MKKRISAIILIAAVLLAGMLPAHAAETNYDTLAAAEGYHARVGEAEDAFDNGAFTGYLRFGERMDGGGRDVTLADVPQGGVVTLITDVTVSSELYLQGQYTLDGAGHTLTGAFRSDSGKADVTVRHLNIMLTAVNFSGWGRYLIQVETNNICTFEDCTFSIKGVPQYALFVTRGEVRMRNCTLNWSDCSDLTAKKDVFRVDNAGAVVCLEDTEISIAPEAVNLAILTFYQSAALVMKGSTALTAAEGKRVVTGGFSPSITMDSTVSAPVTPADYSGITVFDVWDGTADTSWFDQDSIQISYELDTAAKLAGLAKLVKDADTADYPSSAAGGEPIVFYLTAHLDLAGLEWTPIGSSYDARFGGKLIGKHGGEENSPVIIRGFRMTTAGENAGFVGTVDSGAEIRNLTFEGPVISGSKNTVSVVCGYARSGCVFENITVTDARLSVSGTQWTGGICAYAKYGAATLTNCVFSGDITAGGESSMIGGLIGNAVKGAVLTNCYVSGSIAASGDANAVGGMVGAADAGSAVSMTDCQFDGFLKNSNSDATANGSVIGKLTAGDAETAVSLTRVFVSGLSVGSGANASAGFAWIGELFGTGSLALSVNACSALAHLTLTGTKGTVTVAGEAQEPTVYTLAQVTGAAGKTTVGDSGWLTRADTFPVLAAAGDHARSADVNADYAWFAFGSDAFEITNFQELVGFSVLSKLYDFSGKTVSLTQDIDGSAKLPGQALSAGGALNGAVSTVFRGSFVKNGHSVSGVEFELGQSGTYIVTWVVGENRTAEEYGYGEIPVFKGETARPDDRVYRYAFNGWDSEPAAVCGDVTYTAKWKKTRLKDLPADTEPADTADTTVDPGAQTSGEADGGTSGCQSVVTAVLMPVLALTAALPVLFTVRLCKPEERRSK